MNEVDMQLARAMVAEEKQRSASSTPGGSPLPMKKTVISQILEKTKAFRNMISYLMDGNSY